MSKGYSSTRDRHSSAAWRGRTSSDDWRARPRKRVLLPGSPSQQELDARKAKKLEGERKRARRRRFAKQAITLFETAFAVAVLHELDAAATVEAARPAPVAVDRET